MNAPNTQTPIVAYQGSKSFEVEFVTETLNKYPQDRVVLVKAADRIIGCISKGHQFEQTINRQNWYSSYIFDTKNETVHFFEENCFVTFSPEAVKFENDYSCDKNESDHPIVAYIGSETFEVKFVRETLDKFPKNRFVLVKKDGQTIGCISRGFSLGVTLGKGDILSTFTFTQGNTVIDFDGEDCFAVYLPESVQLEDDFVILPKCDETPVVQKKSWFSFW